MVGILKMDPITLPSYSDFIGNGYLQHASTEYLGQQNMGDHFFLVLDDVPPQDSCVWLWLEYWIPGPERKIGQMKLLMRRTSTNLC